MRYSQLISCLLVAELNNKLLMKNHESCPTRIAPFLDLNANMFGSVSFLEMNAAVHNNSQNNYGYGCGRARGCGCGRGHGCGREKGCNNYPYHHKWINPKDNENEKENVGQNNLTKNTINLCYQCGMKRHWPCTCRTVKHLVKLYQTSIKGKEKNVEVNMTYQGDSVMTNFTDKVDDSNYDANDFNDITDITHLDASDFFDSYD
ncbi:hypothetical protein ACH5RR_028504 [Cinchona calisaya]|uniref:CCHC-type domain-containing protein n=1 Tax=Cinchona calisaya TaxID=153742 RepID=A0ABD2YU97_9GENT